MYYDFINALMGLDYYNYINRVRNKSENLRRSYKIFGASVHYSRIRKTFKLAIIIGYRILIFYYVYNVHICIKNFVTAIFIFRLVSSFLF